MQTLDQQTVAQIVLSLLRKTAERSLIWVPTYDQRMIEACLSEINAGDSLFGDIYTTYVGAQYLRLFCYYLSNPFNDGSRAVSRGGYVYQLDIYDANTLGPLNSFNNSSALYDLYNCIKNSENSLNALLVELRK